MDGLQQFRLISYGESSKIIIRRLDVAHGVNNPLIAKCYFSKMVRNHKYGFTLIELSIGLVIIGLIVGGVLVGRDLIAEAEIRSNISQLESFKTAANVFSQKYDCMPGDCDKATTYFGQNPAPCSQQSVSDTLTTMTCNGNGDEILGTDYSNQFEHMLFWQHLAAAGLISGNYSGQVSSANTGAYRDSAAGVNVPASKINGASWSADHLKSDQMQMILTSYSGWLLNTNIPAGGIFHLGLGGKDVCGVAMCNTLSDGAALTPFQALSIDRKIDDGQPGTGSVQAYYAVLANGAWHVNCVDQSGINAAYKTSVSTAECALLFYQSF